MPGVEAKALEVELAIVRPEKVLVVSKLAGFRVLKPLWVPYIWVNSLQGASGWDPRFPFVMVPPWPPEVSLIVDYLRSRGHPKITETQLLRLFDVG